MRVRTLISAADFEQLANQIGPCELVRGEVVPLSPGGFGHSRTTFQVATILGEWAKTSGLGRVITNEAGVVVETDPDTVRGADVAYFSYERLPRGSEPEGFCIVPPNVVVEILGKGQGWREMIEKVGEYLRMGVDRVWLLDRDTERLHVYRADGEPVVLGGEATIRDDEVLPGFSCAVADLLAA